MSQESTHHREAPGELLERLQRQTNPYRGIDTITIYAGGAHVYLPARVRRKSGISDRLVVYVDRRPGIITFSPATQHTMRRSFGCRTGMMGATSFPGLWGYIPLTRWVPVEVGPGRVVVRLADLYAEAPIIELQTA